jgi:proline dehydrogenase
VRQFFLFLSNLRWLRRWMEESPFARRLSCRFVAGSTLENALGVCRRVYSERITVTLDHLGEHVTQAAEAHALCDETVLSLDRLAAGGFEPNVSIKLSQFGIDLDESLCRANLERLVAAATALNGFVRVDMESSAYIDRTLGSVRDLHTRYPVVGTVIQAYLLRAEKDLTALCDEGIRIRLVKGAYLEPHELTFAEKSDVDANFIRLMKILLERGHYPAIATHDEAMIDATKAYAAECGVSHERFEFQMLYGIRRDLQRQLVTEGFRVRLYVPYGVAWYPYFMRRLAERPANVLFLMKNLFR